MPVTVVVGGQFGGEGKGKVAHFFARHQQASVAVRCGGSNSGHTVVDDDGITRIFRHLPTAAVLPDVDLVLGAGTYIDVDVLLAEIDSINLPAERLHIDCKAVIITPEHKAQEQVRLVGAISSTGSGTGAAVSARVMRADGVMMAKDVEALAPYRHDDTSGFIREFLDANKRVIIEGTQGFGLSNIHSPFYPCVTSRDTTAGTFIGEVGLSPLDVDEVVLTLRAFPIRVGGKSGKLPNEISWHDLAERAAKPDLIEYTTVTKKPRRIALFDPEIVKKAIAANRPSIVVLNHLDYLGKIRHNDVAVLKFVTEIEESINYKIDYLGMSPASPIYSR